MSDIVGWCKKERWRFIGVGFRRERRREPGEWRMEAGKGRRAETQQSEVPRSGKGNRKREKGDFGVSIFKVKS
jgi:hypothetical protein